MENQKDLSLLEMILMAVNNCLVHKKLFAAILLLPTLVMFVLVMWVFEPEYRIEAVFTSPVEGNSIDASGMGKMMGEIPGGSALSGLLGKSDEAANVTWTLVNSWELHDKIIKKFDLAKDYEFKGEFYADLLKKFRSNLHIEVNDEEMFEVSFEHKDYRKAAAIMEYFLAQADSMYNAYKTTQARQMREFIDDRIAEINAEMDSLKKELIQFQQKNNFYDPDAQVGATLRYMSAMQSEREAMSLELAYEKSKQGGEKNKRIDDLELRLHGLDKSINQTMQGKQSNMGLVAINKAPELSAKFMQMKSDLKIQQTMYMLLREQREQFDINASSRQVNLIVLQPPWENNKKVFPKRGVMLMFTFFLSGVFAIALCSFIEFMKNIDGDSTLAREKNRLFALLFRRK